MWYNCLNACGWRLGYLNWNNSLIASFKPTWEWQITMFSKPTWGWQNPHFSLLASSKLQTVFQTNEHVMFCSNLGDLVYTCMLCASHSNSRLINRNKNACVFKNEISRLVEADLRIGRKGVLIADFPQSYLSSRAETTLVMTDTWP